MLAARARPRSTRWCGRHRSGRRSLVLGATTDHVVGMDPDESRALLDDLLERSTAPERVYRHEWAVGDLVIWDNRGVLHRALPLRPDVATRHAPHHPRRRRADPVTGPAAPMRRRPASRRCPRRSGPTAMRDALAALRPADASAPVPAAATTGRPEGPERARHASPTTRRWPGPSTRSTATCCFGTTLSPAPARAAGAAGRRASAARDYEWAPARRARRRRRASTADEVARIADGPDAAGWSPLDAAHAAGGRRADRRRR